MTTEQRPGTRPLIPLLILLGVVLTSVVLFYQVIKSLLWPLFLAAVVALLLHPWHLRLTKGLRGHGWLSSLILTLALLLLLIGPLAAGGTVAALKIRQEVQKLEASGNGTTHDLVHSDHPQLVQSLDWVSAQTGMTRAEVRTWILRVGEQARVLLYDRSVEFLGGLPGFVLACVMFVLGLFFFLKDGELIIAEWDEISPLDADYDQAIRTDFSQVCRGVVWATLVAAMTQGILLVIGLFVIDLVAGSQLQNWIILLGVLTVLFAMVPLLGAVAVWAPTALWLYLNGQPLAAALLTVYGGVIVSQADNVVRVLVLKDSVHMHPLLVFVCVFGGLQWFGILGVFVGPLVGAVLFSLLRILKNELVRAREAHNSGMPPPQARPEDAPPTETIRIDVQPRTGEQAEGPTEPVFERTEDDGP